jgi:putative transposase
MAYARGSLPLNQPVHITNRGNDKRQLFFEAVDYERFIELLGKASERFAVDVLAYGVMPNHFHLVLRQSEPGAVSAYMHWVSYRNACHFRKTTATTGLGHVFQRRFWSDVLGNERHYFAALRYVEANGLRARLVERAEDWRWGSLWERVTHGRTLLTDSPVPLPAEWLGVVNGIQPTEELELFLSRRSRRRDAQPAFP